MINRALALSIRSQIAMLLSILALAFVGVVYSVQVWFIMPAFEQLEVQEAERKIDTCSNAVDQDLEVLTTLTLDWSAWTDLYDFVEDRNERFLQTTLNDEAYVHADANLMLITTVDHRLVWGGLRSLPDNREIDAPETIAEFLKDNKVLNHFEDTTSYRRGILSTRFGPLMFAARPIVTSEGTGPVRGTVTFGRFLNEAVAKRISQQTHNRLTVFDLPNLDSHRATELAGIVEECERSGSELAMISQESMVIHKTMHDVYGRPAVLLQAVLPRAVTAQGRLSVQAATGCSIIGAVATVAVIWTVLTWRVIHPLLVMVDFAKRLGRSDDLESQLDFDRTDEIGTLADAFDEMVIGLAESRRRVLESAHQAGMAEIASEVLHNVGNAVNSTYCSVEVLHENLEKSKASGLQKAAELLAEQAPRAHEFFSSDPRGPKLIDYIGKLSDALQDEKSANLAELERIRMTVCHIRDAIAAQQDIARRSEFRQSTSIRKLVDDVLEMQHEHLRSAGVQVTCRIDIAQNVSVNDSKLTQVLVNLMRNAVHALQDIDPHHRQLKIHASLIEDGSLVMEIIDNGCGFDEAVRARLFTHGFTTKPEGNGLGLHYCANAIREAGGSITAQSDGPGCGAAFRLTLPNVTTDKLKRPDPSDRATESHTSNL